MKRALGASVDQGKMWKANIQLKKQQTLSMKLRPEKMGAPSIAHPGLEPSDDSSRHMQGPHLERPLPAIHIFDLLLSVL